MNSLRATERSISAVVFGSKSSKLASSRRTFKDKGPDFLNQKTPRRSLTSFSYSHAIRFSLRAPRIKSFSTTTTHRDSVKQLNSDQTNPTTASNVSDKQRQEVSILNPNKAAPADLKALMIEPMKPITLPTFVRSSSASDTPSVTRILQATMPAASRFILDKWKETMIKKLGMDGFLKYQKDTFERGKALHTILANYLLGHGEPTKGVGKMNQEIVCNLWNSIEGVVRDKISNVRLVEHVVTHSTLKYRGIIDCVAFYEDKLVVIDFKTAEKAKKNVDSLYDNPLQVTAYCGAINNDTSIPSHVIDRNICSGLVIVAYVDGSQASTYYLDSDDIANNYWKQWTTRLDQYNRMDAMLKTSAAKKPV